MKKVIKQEKQTEIEVESFSENHITISQHGMLTSEEVVIEKTKAREVALAICPELTKQQSANAELEQKLQQANFATSILIDCKEEADFLNKIIELKKQNAELVEVLTTLTDSNLFSNIVHINARAGGKKKLAEAWEKALKLLSKHTT